MEILKLVIIGLFPAVMTVGFYFLLKIEKFRNLNYWVKQIIFGVAFGGLAIIATEFGSNVNGVILNVRDAAPITAGLVFGWPAGIISGFIGGIERFFSAYWNNSFYTQWSCSISTFISGTVAGLLNFLMFKNKKVKWFQALAIGIILETFHILMIFTMNMDDVSVAFEYVKNIGNKMIIANGAAVFLAVLIINILDYFQIRKDKKEKHKMHLSTLIQLILLAATLNGYLVSTIFTYALQSNIAERNAVSLLRNNLDDAVNDVDDSSDAFILTSARLVSNDLETKTSFDSDYLKTLLPHFDLSEISYIDENGIIIYSTVDEYINFDMRSGIQSSEFLVLLEGEDYYVQDYMPTTENPDIYKKYAGIALSGGGFVQVGYTSDLFHEKIDALIFQMSKNRHVGENGFVIAFNEYFKIVGGPEKYIGKDINEIGLPDKLENLAEEETHRGLIDNINVHYMFKSKESYHVIVIMFDSEIDFNKEMTVYVNTYLQLIVFAILFFVVYYLIDRQIGKKIDRVNNKLGNITKGNLNETVDVYSSEEFLNLSNSINQTVSSLKEYSEKEKERMKEELELAKDIQLASLPSKVAYLRKHEFDVYAYMDTAKEVGGDFYDYFLIGEDKLAILIADVSGKGVPAALFMMRTKSMIKSFAEIGLSVEEIFNRTNSVLAEGNDKNMFVTSWMAIINLKTGLLEYTNAGHNPPLLKIDQKYIYLKDNISFVLGAYPGMRYKKDSFNLKPGSNIVLYTDGITEAKNVNEELYGESRLIDYLNNNIHTLKPEAICKEVTDDVYKFANEHEQSDDITMLVMSYYGPVESYRFNYDADTKLLPKVRQDVTDILDKYHYDSAIINKINVSVEEIFVNIASYAYSDKGYVRMDLEISDKQISLTFIDNGKAFNPLNQDDPDITLSASERPIGGLGIFMVKNIMDSIHYSYQEKHNILTMSMYVDKK